MRRLQYFKLITDLCSFKTIFDELNNEYVLFYNSHFNEVQSVADRTIFEATENHIHLLDNIKKDEFNELGDIAERLGQALLSLLMQQFPKKHFMVFVSFRCYDSLTIRFHQKWENEEPFCCPDDFSCSKERVLCFES